jgi:exosortase/archaeosortase
MKKEILEYSNFGGFAIAMNCPHNRIHAAVIVELLFLCFMDRVRRSFVHFAFMSVTFMPP